jgi:hypothetical protein
MGHFGKAVFCAAGLVAAALAGVGSAEAGRKACKGRLCSEEPGVYRFVRAEATIGGKTVIAPVRPGRWGDEVRLPGGPWVDCEITCEYTLRRHTVDFWDGQTNKFVSPGYFRFDVDVDTGRVSRRGPALFGRW